MSQTIKKNQTGDQFFEALERNLKVFLKIGVELVHGARKNVIPWIPCTLWFAAVHLSFQFNLDLLLMDSLDVTRFYLKSPVFEWALYLALAPLGFLGWAQLQVNKKKKLTDFLTNTFLNSGLKTTTGNLPHFVSDFPVDDQSRKLTLAARGIPLDDFKSRKKELQTNLKIYIDDIKENLERGLIEIIYSQVPMPELIDYKEMRPSYNYEYSIGKTRSKTITESFKVSPHLLVAGQTGGGKSTLLRQLITNLYLNHKNATFELIDLKEGLEFQTFKHLPRVNVCETMGSVRSHLNALDQELSSRMNLLKDFKCKDIDVFAKKRSTGELNLEPSTIEKPMAALERRFIVIDEAAEIFLSHGGASTEETQVARKVLSRIARLGRACGMHMIIATQRPDVKAMDSQVKTNLTSIVCFQMPNLPSSMTVLGNGRASQLPSCPGRAIWKSGSQMIEVQTPFMSEQAALSLLEPFKENSDDTPRPKNTAKLLKRRHIGDEKMDSIKASLNA